MELGKYTKEEKRESKGLFKRFSLLPVPSVDVKTIRLDAMVVVHFADSAGFGNRGKRIHKNGVVCDGASKFDVDWESLFPGLQWLLGKKARINCERGDSDSPTGVVFASIATDGVSCSVMSFKNSELKDEKMKPQSSKKVATMGAEQLVTTQHELPLDIFIPSDPLPIFRAFPLISTRLLFILR